MTPSPAPGLPHCEPGLPWPPLMPGTAAGVGLAYRPRSPSNTLTDVVEDHLGELLRVWDERYRKDHGPFHPRLEKLFEAFLKAST